MTLNISARPTKIIIGGKDFTPCLIYFKGADSHLDQTGLITFNGSLTLGGASGFDESLDDRKNPRRFCRGTPIIIEVMNSLGAFVRHPRGALRILSPLYDDETKRQELQIGNLINLLNFREPVSHTEAEDISTSYEGKPVREIILDLLAKAGINSVSGILPDTIYNYPLNLAESYLASAGKLLYANNLFGWIDKNEIFQIKAADISYTPANITIVIGKDEISYKRLTGAEAPVEVVKAVGTEMLVRPTSQVDSYSEKLGAASIVNPDYGDYSIVIETNRTKKKWDKKTGILTTTTYIEKPYGLVVPEIFWGDSQPLMALIDAERRIEKSWFEIQKNFKLKLKQTNIYRPIATYLAEFKEANPNFLGGSTALVLYSTIHETYNYDSKERPTKINTDVSEIKISILNNTDEDWSTWELPPLSLVPAERKEEEWKELGKDNWQYEATVYQPLVRVSPGSVKFDESGISSNKTTLIPNPNESIRRSSNSGQEIPPAPERRPSDISIEENNIEQKVFFGDADGCDLNLKPRERTFSVDFLAGRVGMKPIDYSSPTIVDGGGPQASAQLRAIAQREGRLLQGRYKGQEISTGMMDELSNYSPLYPIQVVEQDGTIRCFLADGGTFVSSLQKSLFLCDGIWVGTKQGSEIIRPYTEPPFAFGGLGLGGQATSYLYTLDPIISEAYGGLGLGETSLRWNNMTKDQWNNMTKDQWNKIV